MVDLSRDSCSVSLGSRIIIMIMTMITIKNRAKQRWPLFFNWLLPAASSRFRFSRPHNNEQSRLFWINSARWSSARQVNPPASAERDISALRRITSEAAATD